MIAVAVAVLAVAATLPMPAGAATSGNLIVGFSGRYVDLALLETLGATVEASSERLGIAAVRVADVDAFTLLALDSAGIVWVESNDRTFAESASWDASTWDSSTWDSSTWDASTWDGSTWDASTWDASTWDGSTWDASTWDASRWDEIGWDGSTWDASTWDASRWDDSGWDGSGWNASGWNAGEMTRIGSTQGPAGTDPLVRWQWGLAAANVSYAAASAPNARTICFVDSGVDLAHPDLRDKIAADPGWDFVNGDGDPSDDGGHGTHVAGIAAATLGNGLGIAGASGARVMAMKVLGADGIGTEFNLARGIDGCTARNASVISMSLGTEENSKAIHRAVVDAFSRGIVLVASVGNTGSSCDCVRWPAAYPQVVAVGALMPDGQVAPFSAVSSGVDFVAPGYAILSTLPDGRYAAGSGTSQAVPWVSATVAMLLERGASGPEATAALRQSARDLGPAGHDREFGFGALDAGAALARLTLQ